MLRKAAIKSLTRETQIQPKKMTQYMNIHRHLRFAAVILAVGHFAVAGTLHAGDDVPFKLKGAAGIIQSANITGGFTDPLCGDFDPDAPEFEGLVVIDNTYGGEANATQLGKHSILGCQRFTVVSEELEDAIVGVDPGDLGSIILGSFTSTQTHIAANGDELIIEAVGTFFVAPLNLGDSYLLLPVVGNGIWEIVGGTGRFENATGAGEVTTGLTADGEVTINYDGLISSLGSRRGNGKK